MDPVKQRLFEKIRSSALLHNTPERPLISQEGVPQIWLFDFRTILLDPNFIDDLAEAFWQQHESSYPFQVGGLEVASIPIITAIVMKGVALGKPVSGFFIRKSRKQYGTLNLIEGTLNDTPIILVDDIINSGKSFEKQRAILFQEKKTIAHIWTIVDFQNEYGVRRNLESSYTSLFTLGDFGLKYTDVRKATRLSVDYKIEWFFQSSGANFFHVVPKSGIALDGQSLYAGSDTGILRKISQTTGSEVWARQFPNTVPGKGTFSTPLVFEETVYCGAYNGNLYALDASTGANKWAYEEADWIGSSPALSKELGIVFIGLEFGLHGKRGGIAAVDTKTGVKIWDDKSIPEYVHSTPLYIPQLEAVVIGGNDGVVRLYKAKTGHIIWEFQSQGPIKASFAYHEPSGYIFFGSFDGNLYALNGKDGLLAFKQSTDSYIYSTPLVVHNSVYVSSTDKYLYCIDIQSEQLKWKFQTKGRMFSSPTASSENIFVGSNDGRMYEINKDTGEELSYFQAHDRITNSIAINPENGKIFLPTYANSIYCLSK